MSKTEILEYIRTILIALLIALTLAAIATGCSKVVAEHHAKMLTKMTNNAKDNEVINYLITVYKEKAVENPSDYMINVKLGNLYELIFDYYHAEQQYKTAISKSPYGVYSSYFGLANLYVKLTKYKKALTIVKKLNNKDYKPLLVAKGDFYMNLGDALWQDGNYEDAVSQYKLAFFYYKKVDSKKKNTAIDGIIDCYNKIADINFKKRNPEKAIENLETALLYRENAVIYYKLAILYKDFNPLDANMYMEKTYVLDPGIINFDIYEEILISLINYYYLNGKDIEKELYQHKLKAIKNFQKRYVITEKDIKININKLRFKSNLLNTKFKLDVKYTIENTSKYDFNTLYVVAKLRYDDKSREIYNKKLYSKKEPLKSRNESPEYKFRYTYDDKDELFAAETLWLDIYAGKKENMRKIPVFSIEIKK